MTAKKASRKPQSRAADSPNLLDKLESHEAAAVLSGLLARHAELRTEAEAIARSVLGEVSMLTVAGEVEDALLQFDYDDLNGRAGSHSWGYVEPSEGAGELLEEAIEPFVAQMTRHLEMGLESEALVLCQGILLGLYQVRDGAGNDILGWAPDFPDESAAHVVGLWTGKDGAKTGRRRNIPPEFVREHLPEWDWILEAAGQKADKES
ncbi:MAG: hypothetical protein AAB654_19345 [Acidobacteriota bacterium]